MNSSRQAVAVENRRRSRPAYTLAEVLLVLALMAVIAALALPTLRKPFAVHRLRAAADSIRAEWLQARVQAMRTGQTYVFRFQIGGDKFHAAPEESQTAEDGADLALQEDKSLPEGIKFTGVEAAGGGVAGLSFATEMNTPDDAAAAWSDPIYFYPDGTTSDVRVVLEGDQGRSLCVVLRAVTGTASVAETASNLE